MDTARPTRRRFLQGAGVAVGGTAIGAQLARFGPGPATASLRGAPGGGLDGIDHIVVLMLENRSFDNVVGRLYGPANVPPGQSFDGVLGKSLSNPVPGGGVATPGVETVLWYPNPDPGEVFDDVYVQMFNTTDPPLPNRTDVPGMQGFVNNYSAIVAAYDAKHPTAPAAIDPRAIMNGYEPGTLSVINGLAQGYAVCDHWFSSIPTQTFCNRSFVHAGTSSGYVNNLWSTGPKPLDVGVFANATPTIHNLLEAAGVSWRIYHGGSLAFCIAFLTQVALRGYATIDPATNRFFPMAQFTADAAAGTLPAYSFIEPHFLSSLTFGPENDGHPPDNPVDIDGPSNLLRAELLVHDVYTALRTSPAWERTLLVLTFDEHGGCYDHVPPPLTVSPDGKVVPPSQPGGSGFAFGRLGLRVPTILVSPRISAGQVVNTQFDHTSIIKTVISCFGITDGSGQPATLLAREAAANDLSGVFDQAEARTDTVDLPFTEPPPFDPSIERPLSGFQRDLVAAAAKVLEAYGDPVPDWTEIATTEEATQVLHPRVEALRVRHTGPPEPTFTG